MTAINRRRALSGTAAVAIGAPLLAACGGDEPKTAVDPADSSDSSSSPGSASPSASNGGEALARTSDVEVGGALFLNEPSIVITQPQDGEFHAFSRTCTHQKCPVTDILDGKIHCSCHDSLFDMTTGENVGGPAPSPLQAIEITVDGDSITQA